MNIQTRRLTISHARAISDHGGQIGILGDMSRIAIKSIFICAATFWAFTALPAAAQIYKCRGANGGTTYSGIPCHGTQTSNGKVLSQPESHLGTDVGSKRDMSLLDKDVLCRLVAHDYDGAEKIALTPQQESWVRQARTKEIARDKKFRSKQMRRLSENVLDSQNIQWAGVHCSPTVQRDNFRERP
jgi:hypothetical protein